MSTSLQPKERLQDFIVARLGLDLSGPKSSKILLFLLHVSGWCILFFLPLFFYPVRVNSSRFFLWLLVDKSLLVAVFYINYYLLLPRFFERKKYLRYLSVVLALFLLYIVQSILVRTNNFPGPGLMRPIISINHPLPDPRAIKAPNGDFNVPPQLIKERTILGVPYNVIGMSLNNAVSSFALILAMGGLIRLSSSFMRSQHEKKALENANLNAELNFLKSQINPHFLFNTLNGIYAQAHSRSEHTEDSILKLSDLLRYMLYESGEDKVDLTKDIQYAGNYIDLQKLRLSKKVNVAYEVKGDTNRKKIAPLLLITFIENAFKHGISYINPSVININIQVFEETLTLRVSNPVVENNTFAGGLGLKNVIRRLDLLYPSNYLLDIVRTDHSHTVTLKINLGD